MSVYLQFDSSARSDPYIVKDVAGTPTWVPNDDYRNASTAVAPLGDPFQTNKNLVQSPARYRVFYRELNDANNIRTIGFLAHCKERPVNLNFSVESCTLVLPANAVVPRVSEDGSSISYVSILDEPYIYVRMMPINHSEGNLIYSNNPAADEATFILWCDKIQFGVSDSPPIADPIERPNPELTRDRIGDAKWVVYKSCMITVMRLDLQAQEWQIRIYDRFGNDVILAEQVGGDVATNPDPPAVDPDLQTMLLVGIKPNYPL